MANMTDSMRNSLAYFLCTAFTILVVLLAHHPARAQEDSDQSTLDSPIVIASDKQSDAAIADRVRSIFEEIGEFNTIRIEVNAGVVTLRGTTLDLETASDALRLAGRVDGVVTVLDEINQEASIKETLAPAMDRLGQRLEDTLVLMPLFGVALLALLLFVVVGFWIARLTSLWTKIAPNAFIADLLRQIVRLGFIVAGVVIALDIIGAAALLGTLLGAAGIVGLAVGFAVRDTIENYVASIMLSLRQPFRPNDHVRIEKHEGHVIRLTSRATILMTLDGNHVRIPNSSVFKGIIVNYTRNPERMFEFRLGVDADSNVKQALALGVETMGKLEYVLFDPSPVAWVEDVGDSNVVLWFGGWIDQRVTDFKKARGEAIRLTKQALETAGFTLPEPIYRLRLDDAEPPGPALAETSSDSSEIFKGSSESPKVGEALKGSAIAQKVAAEREEDHTQDLLDSSAPSE